MRLVQLLVEEGDVKPAVDPVDAEIREPQEEQGRKNHVRPGLPSSDRSPRSLGDRIVELAVPAHVADEPGEREEVEHRERLEGGHDLHVDLVLEEPRVQLHPVVEDAVVAERGDAKVEEDNPDVGDGVEGDRLAKDRVAGEVGDGGERGEEGRETCWRRRGGEVGEEGGGDDGDRKSVV